MCVSAVSIHAGPDIHPKGNPILRKGQDISMTEIGDPEPWSDRHKKQNSKTIFRAIVATATRPRHMLCRSLAWGT